MTEWAGYSCEVATGTRWRSGDCTDLVDVRHVAHVADARRIIEDGKLKARLVYDESRLNRTRMHVCWVSANHWSTGSIYGTIEFTFKWADLVKGRQVYWVEAMTGYRPHAYRFLLTDRDAGSLKHVTPYDPITADGPLRQKGTAWFWNGEFTAEFMIDADLSLDLCHRLNFIKHNPRMCRLFGTACKERNQHSEDSAAYIFGYLIGSGIATVNQALMPDIGLPDGRPSLTAIQSGVIQLWIKLGGIKPDSFSGPIKSAAPAKRIVRAGILQYAIGDAAEARRLVSVLGSVETFTSALEALVREHFDLPSFEFG